MKKGNFDTRLWIEIVNDLVTERTVPGDKITLEINYKGFKKPDVFLNFETYDPEKKIYSSREEITDFIDESPSYEIIDDTTGERMPGEFTRGASSWEEYVQSILGPTIKSVIMTGGREFDHKEIEKDA